MLCGGAAAARLVVRDVGRDAAWRAAATGRVGLIGEAGREAAWIRAGGGDLMGERAKVRELLLLGERTVEGAADGAALREVVRAFVVRDAAAVEEVVVLVGAPVLTRFLGFSSEEVGCVFSLSSEVCMSLLGCLCQ